MRDERQKEFWRLVIKLEEFYDIRDIIADQVSSPNEAFACPLSAFHAMLAMESYQQNQQQHQHGSSNNMEIGHHWLAVGLRDRGGVHSVFHLWLDHLFPTWTALKAARSTPNFWKRSVRVIIASVLGTPPRGVTLDINDCSDSLPRSPIVAPTVRISHNLPSLLTQEAYHGHALAALQRAESALERVLFKQACLDHLLVRLLAIHDAKEYTTMQSNFVAWAEIVVLDWLASSTSSYVHTLSHASSLSAGCTPLPTTPTSSSSVEGDSNASVSSTSNSGNNTTNDNATMNDMDHLPQAVAALLKSLLPGRAVRAAPAHTQRVVRWRGSKHIRRTLANGTVSDTQQVTSVTLTSEDQVILSAIRERMVVAQMDHQRHLTAMKRLVHVSFV
jgi:hypothetical protein